MCSRYFLDADGNIIAYTFQVPVNDRIRRRFNIAPTQEAPVIRVNKEGQREAAMLRWGLVPFWAKDISLGIKLINARCESVAEKPAFREALRSRRCIVPASGFFEWTGNPGRRIPHAITVEGRPLIAMAGLWERWKDPAGARVETFTIITTDANPFVAKMHDRMPAIVPPEHIDAWLDGPVEAARDLLRPYAEDTMRERTVNPMLNSPDNDSEELLKSSGPQQLSL